MKKIKSLLALLLLGGMVLSGCGDKDKGGNPSDSGTPSTPSGTDDSSGGTPQGNDQGSGGNQGGGETIVASWPSTTVQMYLDLLGVEHDRVPSIQNDAITSYAITSDATAVQTEQGFTIACVGGGSLLNSYIDTLLANGYTYRENAGCYMTPLGEVCIGLDVIEGNLVIIVMLPNAGGGGGGGQHGGGGGGGEVPTDSQFVNKKFVFDSLSCPQDQSLEATLTANYQGAYAALFSNGKFQLVSVVNTYTMALLGDFTVAEDDSYARLDVRKEYDGETQGYEYLESGTFVTNLRFNEGLQKYVLPMRNSNGMGGTINFDVYLTLSNELPQAADLPDDPNGDEFDPAYQVRKDVWDRLIVNRDLIHSSAANYVVTSGSSVFEIDNGTKFYEHADSATQGNGTYYERTSINGQSYNYDVTTVTGGVAGPSYPVEYMIDQFDIETGVAPIPFNWMQYNSVGHYYWRNSYTYQHSTQGSRTLNNYRVYFGANYRIQKITFTDNAQQEFEFIFSNHGQIDLNLDDLTNGGGGGGGGQQQNDEPTDYYQYVQNKTLSYNRVSDTGDLSSEELQNAAAANANIAVGVFNDLSIEMQWPDHFYYDGENCSMSVLMYGSLQFSSFGTLSGRRVARGSVTITGLFINGADESGSPHEMPAMWDIANNQFVIKMDDPSNGDQYYLFLDTSNTAPTHIPQPQAPESQLSSFKLMGVNNDWTVGISGTDATIQAEVTNGDYAEQRRFDFTAQANEEIKVNSGDIWLGYDSLELGCQALATRVTGGQEDNNIRLNEAGNYSLYLKLHSNSTYSIWLAKESVAPAATWPSAWVDALYAAWGINNDIIPECGTTGVTTFMTSPETPTNGDTYGVIAAIGGESLYDSYVAALKDALYAPNAMGYYVSANKELMILPQVSAGALSIMIFPYDSSLEINDASLIYYDGYNTQNIELEYDNVKDEYFIKDVFLYEEFEFFLYIPGEGSYYFDDFVERTPDTSKGNISQGSEFETGNYGLYVEEDGSYDIYLNSSREIDVVYDMIPLLQYGSDLEGWLTEPFEKVNGQLELHDFYLEAGTEVVIQLSLEGEGGTWLHYDNFVETEFSAGKIGGTGASNLTILVSGNYTFYVIGGSIYIVYEGE